MASDQSDRFIMLLSADWFTPYWQTFGLVFSESEQRSVREVARKAIEALMKDAAVYWGADFHPARITATYSDFLAGLRRAGLSDTAVSQLTNTLNAVGELEEVTTTLWLFGALCDQWCGSSADEPGPPGMSAAGIQTVRSLWQLSETLEPSRRTLDGALKASDTPWDRFLRNATPDLPTCLSDWAMVRLRRPERFRRFWAQLFWTVSQSDRRAFKTWLQKEALKLADPSFDLVEPAWMRVE